MRALRVPSVMVDARSRAAKRATNIGDARSEASTRLDFGEQGYI
jgi:hypothetical protein